MNVWLKRRTIFTLIELAEFEIFETKILKNEIESQWRIQEFKNRGALSRRGIIFEVWRLF